MPDANPVASVLMRDYCPPLVTVVWQGGTRRTIAASNPADLVLVGIMVKGNEPPAAFDERFMGKLVEEPRTPAELLKLAVERSAN